MHKTASSHSEKKALGDYRVITYVIILTIIIIITIRYIVGNTIFSIDFDLKMCLRTIQSVDYNPESFSGKYEFMVGEKYYFS